VCGVAGSDRCSREDSAAEMGITEKEFDKAKIVGNTRRLT
jgi:hypothetical protein